MELYFTGVSKYLQIIDIKNLRTCRDEYVSDTQSAHWLVKRPVIDYTLKWMAS